MKRIISRRPSAALVIACMSLFVALGGVSYGVATGSIDSREIKNGSVRGADVKNKSLTGSDVANNRLGGGAIKESTLGKVPSAGTADSATTAGSASTATNAATAGNANQLGGQGPAKFATRWALVNEEGDIEQQTGGFTIRNCYDTDLTSNANCYLSAGEDVRDNGIHAQIAIQNNDSIGDPTELNGETGAAPCGATFVTCAPDNTEANDVLVVAPRQSDGAATVADARFRFYVYVTGSESATP